MGVEPILFTMPLKPCPASPNCVSSDEAGSHAIAPFKLKATPSGAWDALRRALADIPRVKIVQDSGSYLHAEFTSRLLRFVDDVELELRPDAGIIAVRSASRLGYSDFGVNRKRVEDLRRRLQATGAIE